MNVLSLFDGMSCGQLALQRAGIKVDNYYASEIDKYAIQVAQKNFPKTIQVGDITKLKVCDLPKIDLLIGGSPCQGFSLAGKQLNFEDPRSKLFFEFVRLKNELNPKFFMLENVKMKKQWEQVITKYMGVNPVVINSTLLSAQNRVRYYWGNFIIQQPNNLNIKLKDLIENGFVDRDKSYCIDASYYKGGNLQQYYEKSRRQLVFGYALRGRYNENKKVYQRLEFNGTEKSNCLTTVQKDSLIFNDKGFRKLTPIECERLQTLPDNYTEGVSNSQRYKMIGNGWTVDVIAHIFKCMLNEA